MLFNSLDFLVFFPLVTVLYFLIPHRVRWLHLLIASCIFYMSFIPAYILILLFTITLDYVVSLAMEKVQGRLRKLFLAMSLAGNLGVLGVFKYGHFFIAQVNVLLSAFHTPVSLPLWDIVLPIGLSFHTFQAMSYTIEVYRGRYPAERHFGLFALYVLFYPQLLAGPIERPSGLLRQLHEKHFFSWADMGAGFRLMLWGFFKKVVIADRLAGFVNDVYSNVDHLSSGYVVLAVLFFSFQIYCDFSGYSDIAIGAARTMGIRLMTNFDRPYSAGNIRAFWARWHISLTSWFRDYVYIPLGGNRLGKQRKYFNVVLVFLLSGLWHGAGWNFVVWGALHALLMVIWMSYSGRQEKKASGGSIGRGFAVVGTFLLVSLGWVFFRCPDIGQALHIISHLIGHSGNPGFERNITKTTVALGMVFISFLLLVERWTTPGMDELQGRFWPDVGFCAVVPGSILLFGVFGSQPFIYFQF